jgi:chromosome segregation ATPase
MIASAAPQPATDKVVYKSPKHAQVWFLRRSRDLWKRKYQSLKAQAKRLQNQTNAVTNSRQEWRDRAEDAEHRLAQLQRQYAQLQASLPPAGEKGGQ